MGEQWTPVKGGLLWRDKAFTELSVTAKLIFLWSWTSEQSRISGLYRVTRKELASPAVQTWDTEADQLLEDALGELEQKPLLLYDDAVEVIWVVNRVKHANTSERHSLWIYEDFKRCPECELKTAFKRRYRGVLKLGEERDAVRREQTRLRVQRHRERVKGAM